MAEFPHLIEITKIDDGRRVYIEGLGIEINDLTREELIELVHSTRYVCRKAKNALVRTVKECDSLWDIEGMPEEALKVLKRIAPRVEDDPETEWESAYD